MTKLYSINELAKLINRHPVTIYRDLKNNPENLPKHIVIGRRVFFTDSAVEAFLRGEKEGKV